MPLKIPESMYSKGPKNNPAPAKKWDTSGSRAYGDAELRMLNPPPPPMPTLADVMITVKRKK